MHAYLTSQASGVAGFLARLMSLSAHELQCLHADQHLMRQLADTRHLLEQRLQLMGCCRRPASEPQAPAMQRQRQRHLYLADDQHALDLSLERAPGAKRTRAPLAVNPKKAKLSEWRRNQARQDDESTSLGGSPERAPEETPPAPLRPASASAELLQRLQMGVPARTRTKKYKGEFDEPTPSEVERRQLELATQDNYHRLLGRSRAGLAECACVLGSRFPHRKSAGQVLEMIDAWARLPAGQRVLAKWDVCDLPEDIALADIKRFEDMRSAASAGRADFGGASKRKPLGIRGTRQFLLILYCLWGHPGRDDPMQKQGYCPHCFAKIKKSNEQSTLVRVVNHFNMKHRMGANPRLSPARDRTTPTAAQPAPQAVGPASAAAAQRQRQQPAKQQQQQQPATTQIPSNQRHLFANLFLLAASSAASSPASTTPPSPESAATGAPSAGLQPGDAAQGTCRQLAAGANSKAAASGGPTVV